MPSQAPAYGDLKVASRPLDTPLVNPGIASADAFGASKAASGAYISQGVLQGAQGIANGLRIQQQEEEKRDETEALDAVNNYMIRRNKDMPGYLGKTGKNALGVSGEAKKGHDVAREEIATTLKSPGAKDLFNRMAAKRWADEDRVVQGHEVGQIKQYQSETFEDSIKLIRQDAVDSGDPAQIQQAASMQHVTRLRLADLNGENPQETELKLREDSNQLFGGHIQAMLSSGNYQGAKVAYDSNKENLHGKTKEVLGEQVKVAGINQTAQTNSDLIMSDPGQTKARAYAQANVIEDPGVRARTKTNIDRTFSERAAAKDEMQGSTYEDYAKRIDAGEPLGDIMGMDSRWNALDASQMKNLRGIEKDYIENRKPAALSDNYISLRNSAAELPQEFMAHDFRKERGQITESERGQLVELQADMKSRSSTRSTPSSKPVHGLLSIEDVANNTLRKVDIEPSVKDGKMDPRAMRFKQLFDRAILANGGTAALNSIQMQGIADRLMIEHAKPDKAGTVGRAANWLTFGAAGFAGVGVDGVTKVRLMDAPNADKMAFSAAQLPEAGRAAAVKALSAAGITDPTEDELLEHYNGHLFNESK